MLELAGLARFFRVTVSSEEVARGKPAPDVYLEAARRLGVAPDRCAADRGLARGHPLREGRRNARRRDPESDASRRATTRSRSPTSCSTSIADLTPETLDSRDNEAGG